MTRTWFAVAAGSVVGAEHRRTDRPNQDAWAWRDDGAVLAAAVADGCGSGRHSEVGARLGAAMWAEALRRWAPAFSSPADPALYRVVRRDVTAQLGALAAAMGGDPVEVVAEHFLFTVVGCVIAAGTAVVHAVGDGLYAIDGEVTELGPFPGNQPPYIGYDLVGDAGDAVVIAAVVDAAAIDSIALATDGALDLEPLPPLWEDPRYLRNRDAIRRHLAVINREAVEPDWEERRLRVRRGALADDTTVLIIRREVS